jgi:integrase
LPIWAIEMLRERKQTSRSRWVLASELGHLRDPSNTRRALQKAFARLGYGDEDLTTHIFRKSVATLMDTTGLSARAAADQLGHADPSFTLNTYFGRKIRVTGAAQALESLGLS